MDLVIGMGEVGNALADILLMTWQVIKKDLLIRKDIRELRVGMRQIETMHICFPYGNDFVDQVVAYIELYGPGLTIIHSTVQPGTTALIDEATPEHPVAYSPVRGRHTEMVNDLLRYKKFVSAPSDEAIIDKAGTVLSDAHFQVEVMRPCEALELAKLLETTYSGILIAWAQEMNRYCFTVGAELEDVSKFFAEIDYLPDHYFHPGYIGGHCIIQNLGLLDYIYGGWDDHIDKHRLIDAIRISNEACTDKQKTDPHRYRPKRMVAA